MLAVALCAGLVLAARRSELLERSSSPLRWWAPCVSAVVRRARREDRGARAGAGRRRAVVGQHPPGRTRPEPACSRVGRDRARASRGHRARAPVAVQHSRPGARAVLPLAPPARVGSAGASTRAGAAAGRSRRDCGRAAGASRAERRLRRAERSCAAAASTSSRAGGSGASSGGEAASPASRIASESGWPRRSHPGSRENGARSWPGSFSARTRGSARSCRTTSARPGSTTLLAVSGQNVAFVAGRPRACLAARDLALRGGARRTRGDRRVCPGGQMAAIRVVWQG